MTRFDDAQRARWLRPNAHLYLRPDAHRFMRPDAKRFLRQDWKRFVQPAFVPVFLSLLEGKANFNPNQPRVPKGNPGGGQWTYEEGWRNGANRPFPNEGRRPGIGHNQGPPLNEPPEIPKQRPPTTQEKFAFIKGAAYWLARATRIGTPSGIFLTALEAASWLDTDRAFIDAYLDSPKTLEELQKAASNLKLGYQKHHIVEQGPARHEGFSEDLIGGAANLAGIPMLKHWQITGWYMTKNQDYGGISPREYLKGKSWEERRRVGLEVLRKFEVLK